MTLNRYAQDSFFTLSPPEQAGLLLLSLALSAVLIWLSYRLGRQRKAMLAVPAVLSVFAAFVWLSPQIYYGYYLSIIDGLPRQIVIQNPPSPKALLSLLLFNEAATLSDHSKGLLGWGMIAAAFATKALSRFR